MPRPHALSTEKHAQMHGLVRLGHSQRRIARTIGVPLTTVQRHLPKYLSDAPICPHDTNTYKCGLCAEQRRVTAIRDARHGNEPANKMASAKIHAVLMMLRAGHSLRTIKMVVGMHQATAHRYAIRYIQQIPMCEHGERKFRCRECWPRTFDVEPKWRGPVAARVVLMDAADEARKTIASDPACPKCGSAQFYKLRNRLARKCRDCGAHYSAASVTNFSSAKRSQEEYETVLGAMIKSDASVRQMAFATGIGARSLFMFVRKCHALLLSSEPQTCEHSNVCAPPRHFLIKQCKDCGRVLFGAHKEWGNTVVKLSCDSTDTDIWSAICAATFRPLPRRPAPASRKPTQTTGAENGAAKG